MFNPPRHPLHTSGTDHQQLHTSPQSWKDLRFWKSGEWQVVQENLRDLDKQHIQWCPGRENLFKAFDLTPLENVKVVLVGQDPYPNPVFATGLAFSIPKELETYPPTLAMMLQEAQTDVPGFQFKNGDLTPWAQQGVLLWNVIPSCEVGKSKSHHWPEWEQLTGEVFNVLSHQDVVFVFLGSVAWEYNKYVLNLPWSKSRMLRTSHPSPRGIMRSQIPFIGSRIFSTINANLVDLGKEPIKWSLHEHQPTKRTSSRKVNGSKTSSSKPSWP